MVNFKNILLNAIGKHVPSKLTSSRRTYQWKTTAVRRRINRKTKLVRKARKQEAKRQRAISKTQSTSSKNFQTADNNYVHDIISPEQTEIPKRFWSFIESKKPQDNSLLEVMMAWYIVTTIIRLIYSMHSLNQHTQSSTPSTPSMPDTNISGKGIHKLL